jgi:3-phytase
MKISHLLILQIILFSFACGNTETKVQVESMEPLLSTDTVVVKPRAATATVIHDTDDPAIWINPADEMKSLIIGTDKDEDGALYVFDLEGNVVQRVGGLKRPNNVDVAYGFELNGEVIDIAVAAERMTGNLRVFRLPGMEPVDGGGIPVYVGETGVEHRDLMGIALYQKPDGKIHAIAGRKTGPTDGTYLWQYELIAKPDGTVGANLLRKFGIFSGMKEIEAIAVDHKLGFIYYSDEQVGVRKYYADPAMGNEELALFANEGYLDDNEGISIYQLTDSTGYIIVSDQARNAFRIYPREGSAGSPHAHLELGVVFTGTNNSDGSEIVTNHFGGKFPGGLFVAMSDDKTFQYYSWQDMAAEKFKVKGE